VCAASALSVSPLARAGLAGVIGAKAAFPFDDLVPNEFPPRNAEILPPIAPVETRTAPPDEKCEPAARQCGSTS
jgi:hypothetical protein